MFWWGIFNLAVTQLSICQIIFTFLAINLSHGHNSRVFVQCVNKNSLDYKMSLVVLKEMVTPKKKNNNDKNLALSLAAHWSFSLTKFLSKEAQNLTSLPPFWTVLSSQAAFPLCHSVRKILSKWLPPSLLTNFEPNMLQTQKW